MKEGEKNGNREEKDVTLGYHHLAKKDVRLIFFQFIHVTVLEMSGFAALNFTYFEGHTF